MATPAICSTCPTLVQTVRRQLDVLDRHCADVGRPAERDRAHRDHGAAGGRDRPGQLTERCHAAGRSRCAARRGHRPWAAAHRSGPRLCCGRRGPISSAWLDADARVNLDPVQVVAEFDLPVECRRRQRAPVVLLARLDARHVVGEDQNADTRRAPRFPRPPLPTSGSRRCRGCAAAASCRSGPCESRCAPTHQRRRPARRGCRTARCHRPAPPTRPPCSILNPMVGATGR